MNVDDNNGELTNLQIERERERVFGRRGADYSTGAQIGGANDSRLTKIIAWCAAFLSAVLSVSVVVIGSTAVSTLIELQRDVAVIKTTVASSNANIGERIQRGEARDDAQEARINNIDGRVYSLEGRTLRGGPEAHRGN